MSLELEYARTESLPCELRVVLESVEMTCTDVCGLDENEEPDPECTMTDDEMVYFVDVVNDFERVHWDIYEPTWRPETMEVRFELDGFIEIDETFPLRYEAGEDCDGDPAEGALLTISIPP